MISIRPASSTDDLAIITGLFQAYSTSLGLDLSYQDFESELAGLPGKYAPPAGALLLARDESNSPLGCVALRPLSIEGVCEMKRLYVASEGRGRGIGKALMLAVIGEASKKGYREMRLDTLPAMVTAQAMYRAAGFEPMEAYYATPVAGTMFLRLRLQRPQA
ncbi:GNAT family N-acetyltransferase [Gloeobacter violaceus]|uniref:Glr0296 protein n=1 Tax=Gloeobacter violaceus (strain ATCC 29082 / PCC 7421) TaxID=251221 RepID=Q7NNW2_GLOVI|nr:GNAT family N-acetyltransferase [Gloeobacter violaceus]BAC88237.1 glr0296 [Gloeobacter violaceus PCC 7421]